VIHETQAIDRRRLDPGVRAPAKPDSAPAEAFADALESEMVLRGVHGVQQPGYPRGKLVGYVRQYGDRLLIKLISAARPKKYRERFSVDSAERIVVRVLSARVLLVLDSSIVRCARGLSNGSRFVCPGVCLGFLAASGRPSSGVADVRDGEPVTLRLNPSSVRPNSP
jgi:hypothetical protein